MNSASVPGFSPAGRGFTFPNNFPSVPPWTITIPTIGEVGLGNAANGLCGGMVFAARDFFEFGVTPPPGTTTPSQKTPLFTYIVDRLLASFDLPLGPARYFAWMCSDDNAIAERTRAEWPQIQKQLDAGKPAPLGLIRVQSGALTDLGKNHQVLAYAYELEPSTGALTVRVYDPNHPNQAVEIQCNVRSGMSLAPSYSTSEPLRGFFLTPYTQRDPRFLLRADAQPPASWWSKLWSAIGRVWPRRS